MAGYWFQVVQNQADFVGQAVNNALKDVGHGVGNITNALSSLQSRKPALVRQVAKSGRTQQARKKYKLTTAGVSAVRAMMNGTNSPGTQSEYGFAAIFGSPRLSLGWPAEPLARCLQRDRKELPAEQMGAF